MLRGVALFIIDLLSNREIQRDRPLAGNHKDCPYIEGRKEVQEISLLLGVWGYPPILLKSPKVWGTDRGFG